MLPKRIDRKIEKTDTCWFWLGCLDRGGYGVVNWHGKASRTHRIVYTVLVGVIPDKLELDHLCNNPPCVNPEHLEPVTKRENIRRSASGKYNTAKWAKPRDCPRGHPLIGDNLITHYSERLRRINRTCRLCKANNQRLRRAIAKST